MVNGAIQNTTETEEPNDQKSEIQIIIYIFLTIFSLLLLKIKLGLISDIKQWIYLN
jgi:hypothetical protein